MLRTRGDFIKFQKWDKLNEINRDITQRIKNNQSLVQDDEQRTEKSIRLPKCAFITIESEVAYNVLSEMGEVELAGWESKLIEAPEPTNVIWENRDFDKTVRWFRLTCIILLVAFVLLLTFLATVQAKILTNELTGKYDTSINCRELDTMYDKKTLEELASDEWVDFYKKSADDSDRQIAATLSCFCND